VRKKNKLLKFLLVVLIAICSVSLGGGLVLLILKRDENWGLTLALAEE